VSNLTYAGRRAQLVLFINGRPVEQGQLRRALEGVYAAHNPKAAKPWVYLDLRLPPRHVEVNLHPTKREVGFLHQQEVVDELCRCVRECGSAGVWECATTSCCWCAGVLVCCAASALEGGTQWRCR
jgi:DNA mismatch repair ATPase MutL